MKNALLVVLLIGLIMLSGVAVDLATTRVNAEQAVENAYVNGYMDARKGVLPKYPEYTKWNKPSPFTVAGAGDQGMRHTLGGK
jgi:hypothetical protein